MQLPLLLTEHGTAMEKDEIESALLHAIEVSLDAQLKAVKRLRAGPSEPKVIRRSP